MYFIYIYYKEPLSDLEHILGLRLSYSTYFLQHSNLPLMAKSLFFVYDSYMVFIGQAQGLRKNAGIERRGKHFEC